MHALIQNLQFTFRHLRRTPAFTLTVVLTLALGIGATTAIFSLVEGVLLRPLPFQDADRLVLLGDHLGGRPGMSVRAREIGRTQVRPKHFPVWVAILRPRLSFPEAHSRHKSMRHASILECFRSLEVSPSSGLS